MKRSIKDALDKKLIRLLGKDARQRNAVLAKKLGVSPVTIKRRIDKLINNQVISIVARPEPTRLNLPLQVIAAFDVAHDRLNYIADRLSSRDEVRWLSVTSGRFDIIAIMWFASTDELHSFMEKEVGDLEGVRNTETFICLHVQKSL